MGWAKVAAVLLLAGLGWGCASTNPGSLPAPGNLPEAALPAPAPAGFVSFCMRFASQCTQTPGTATTIALTAESWRTLSMVNRAVNDTIFAEDDEKHYGRSEYWTIPTDGYGDCDDYAVTKRKELIDAGFPVGALRIAVVDTADNERHAVLTVATDKGDLVLDNMRSKVVAWNDTGFRWIERQDGSDPLKWVSLQPTFAANTAYPTAETSGHN